MRKSPGGMVVLVISIVAGLLAAVLSVSFLQGVTRTTSVLVANQDIPAYTQLDPSMFTLQQLPGNAVPADAVKDPAALTGRYARTMLLKDTVMRQGHLATASGETGSLAAKLTEAGVPGSRAMAIPTDNITDVGGTVQPGDRVDVVASVRLERQNGPTTTYAKIIARAVPVLHRTEAEGTSKGSVVLQVTPQQAEDIAFAIGSGTIYLATNPYRLDAEAEQTQGVTPDTFIQRYGSGR